MEIVIKVKSANLATITIGGRALDVVRRDGVVHLEGASQDELDSTLGGLVALELFGFVSDVQSATYIAADRNATEWDTLDEDVAGEIAGVLM